MYAASTVDTYVSALSYSHKFSGFPDPSKAFVVLQILKGYGKLGTQLDTRLPIAVSILHKLTQSATLLSFSTYQVLLFQAMCSTGFFAFLRVGVITVSNKEGSPFPLQIHQLTKLVKTTNKAVGFKIKFVNFKHNYNQPPFYLVISPQPTLYPVQILLQYLAARGDKEGAISDRPCQGLGSVPSFPLPFSYVVLIPPFTKATVFI